MANTFVFYGKIAPIKDKENFHPIERKTFEKSGWMQTTVKFNCISGSNRVMCMVQGGKFQNDSKNVIRTFSEKINETTHKRDKIDIPWDKRNDPKIIESVAGFRHYVVDTGNYSMRLKLEDAVKAGSISEDLIEETGCATLEEVKEALDKSNKKRHVYLSEYDMAEFCAKLVASDKIKDTIFRISGQQEIQYSQEKGRFYTNYRVQRIELAREDATISTNMLVDFYFGEGCLDDDDFEETGKALLNGWTTYYDNAVKKNGFAPVTIAIRDAKRLRGIKRKLVAESDEIKNVGLSVDVIDGAEMQTITYDDLDDETKMDIEDGLISEEDAIAALGGTKIGDKIPELRLAGMNKAKKNVEATDHTVEDMRPAKFEVVSDSEDMDIFDDEI